MSLTLWAFLQMTAIYVLLSWALYLPFKAGQFYNGPIYSMAIGAYTASMLTTRLGWPLGAALVAAMLSAILFAFLLAPRLARTGMYSMVIATIAIVFITQAVFRNIKFLGGVTGIFGIPMLEHSLPISYGIVFLVGIFIYRLQKSRIGRAMEAVYANRDLARSIGVDPIKISMFLQVASAGIGGIAGALYAFAMGMIRPADFGFSVLLYMWTMLFVGGYQTMWGVVVAAPLLWAISQFLPSSVAEFTNIIFGAALALVLIVRPHGLVTQRLVCLAFSRTKGILHSSPLTPPKESSNDR